MYSNQNVFDLGKKGFEHVKTGNECVFYFE